MISLSPTPLGVSTCCEGLHAAEVSELRLLFFVVLQYAPCVSITPIRIHVCNRFKKGIDMDACNSILIKVNQVCCARHLL